jgi:IclR helix-turn-helix domain
MIAVIEKPSGSSRRRDTRGGRADFGVRMNSTKRSIAPRQLAASRTVSPDEENVGVLMAPAGIQDKEVIQVVLRAFDILRCFAGPSMRLGNREICNRCGLPPSTVSRLTRTLTRIGQLTYLPQEKKYAVGPDAFAFGASLLAENCNAIAHRWSAAGGFRREVGCR